MNIIILENQFQDLTSTTCRQFQLYFYKSLFDPDEKSKILNHKSFKKHFTNNHKQNFFN